MKYLIYFIVSILALAGCKSNVKEHQEYNPEAVELNNRAIELSLSSKKDSALILYDQAIALDSTYYLPHSNKIGIYVSKKEYEKAISEIEMVLKLKPDLAEGWFFAGLLYEHQRNDEKAFAYYTKSIQVFTERINDPSKSAEIVANKLNRALSKKFIGDSSYMEDFNEIRQLEKYTVIVNHFNHASRDEIMKELIE